MIYTTNRTIRKYPNECRTKAVQVTLITDASSLLWINGIFQAQSLPFIPKIFYLMFSNGKDCINSIQPTERLQY